MAQRVAPVGNVQTPPPVDNNNAIRYGYCAFHDISLIGTYGIEHQVQPGDSPFRTLLPCKELIPFITIQANEIDDALAMAESNNPTGTPPVKTFLKSAAHCIEEIVNAYQNFGFRYLEPLTGLPEADAFRIFETIQPFLYDLKDLEYQLGAEAIERINKTTPFDVSYKGFIETLQPLPEHLKSIALKTRAIMADSASQAFKKAADIHAATVQKMTQFHATGRGKKTADPLDMEIFAQLGEEIPQLLKTPDRTTPEANDSYLKTIAEGFGLLAQKPNADTERIARLEAEIAELRAMRQPTAEKIQCAGISKTSGEQCKNQAVNGEFCKSHS